MVTTVVATDLDRTLIYSAAAIAEANRSEHVPPLLCVEMLDGREQSFMTVEASTWLRRIRTRALLVPVTTRTLAQFHRVRLPGGGTEYAVTSNGGHIVVNGTPDDDWRSAVAGRIAADGVGLVDIVRGLDRQAVGPWVLNRKIADGLFCYLVVDLAGLPATFLDTWTAWCADRGWVVSMQGRKIYALPHGLTKEAALADIMQRVGGERLLAAGDGALDAGFLSMAGFAIRPAHGELAEMNWQQAHLRIAGERGVLAGEQICRRLAVELGDSGVTDGDRECWPQD